MEFLDGGTELGTGEPLLERARRPSTPRPSAQACRDPHRRLRWGLQLPRQHLVRADADRGPDHLTEPGRRNRTPKAVRFRCKSNRRAVPSVFGASGLPSGLAFDSASGLISGTLAYTDAETQSGVYSVTVTGYDSNGDSASVIVRVGRIAHRNHARADRPR